MELDFRGLTPCFHQGENLPVPIRTDVSIQIRPAFPDILEDDQVLAVQILIHVTVDATGRGLRGFPHLTALMAREPYRAVFRI
jgi:hypothetical protein